MKEQVKGNFLYNDVRERNKRMNRFYIPVSNVLLALFLFYLWLKVTVQSTQDITYGYVFFNTVLIVLFAIANFILYVRHKEDRTLCYAVLIETVVVVLIIGLKTDADFIFFAMIAVLALQIPYYIPRTFKIFTIIYSIVAAVIVYGRMVIAPETARVDDQLQLLFVITTFVVLYKISSMVKQFSDHALGAVEAQNTKQQKMLDGIMDISKTVANETDKSTELIEQLVAITDTVAVSMSEITEATGMTAENIEEQNTMTQSIQSAIEDTEALSKKMVLVAQESNDSIKANVVTMSELTEQSEVLANTNRIVAEAMSRLNENVSKVSDIVNIILEISNQTNLLALNASIESARAGEAGRGFAVVADQIRQLAEQTKASIGEITKIINQLGGNASDVMKSVNSSVSATEKQRTMIHTAASSFEQLDGNIVQLIINVENIDARISELTVSNNKIVDNIIQLSALTQEVTASAEQMGGLAQNSKVMAEEVKDAVGVIKKKTDVLKGYL
ncbi:MAG: chemotaxis protein [Lachnospiraceae bacterium]|nr:chemotaxis protein [Lachnospiraceae bacterium]